MTHRIKFHTNQLFAYSRSLLVTNTEARVTGSAPTSARCSDRRIGQRERYGIVRHA